MNLASMLKIIRFSEGAYGGYIVLVEPTVAILRWRSYGGYIVLKGGYGGCIVLGCYGGYIVLVGPTVTIL